MGNVADSGDASLIADRPRNGSGLKLSGEDHLMSNCTSAELITPHDLQQSSYDLLGIQQQQQENERAEGREGEESSFEFDDNEEPSGSFNNDPVQFSENLARGNQAVSIPALQPRRQPSPAPAIELVIFPFIGSSPDAGPSPGLERGITPAANSNGNHPTPTMVSGQGEDDNQSSDDGDESSLVKISNANLPGAARAAIILKKYDYDCYANIEVKRCHRSQAHVESALPYRRLFPRIYKA
ncbi:hypothetical protein BYT27DRAFT_6803454 [Phlegmacium glaucopus]|nr:hypothetical protein BYT27DRAFT_6803454 [Phlegmacium glaucopus]